MDDTAIPNDKSQTSNQIANDQVSPVVDPPTPPAPQTSDPGSDDNQIPNYKVHISVPPDLTMPDPPTTPQPPSDEPSVAPGPVGDRVSIGSQGNQGPVSPPPPVQPTPPSPVGGPAKQKENPPLAPQVPVTEHEIHDRQKADEVAKAEGDEYWEKFSREIELEKEIAEMGGVEKVESGEVPIPKDLADQMGIKPSVTIDTPIAKLPTDFSARGVTLDDTQLSLGEKKPVTSAFRWLAEWFILQLKKAHFIVKTVKGKIVRNKVP